MGTFLKVIGVLALVFVAGCVGLMVLGGLAANHASKDPAVQKAMSELKSTGWLDISKFNAIQNGMTQAQVTGIMGKDGTVQSTNTLPMPNGSNLTTTMVNWHDGIKSVNVTFQNDKVMSKAQLGL